EVTGRLAAGVLLKVAHTDVAVQAGAVLDLQPAHLDVSVQLRRFAQRELVAGGELALDHALDGDVGGLDQGLHDRAIPDLHVATDSKLAFSVPAIDRHVTAVVQLALEAVVRAERELLLSLALGVGLAVRVRALSHGLLCIHEPVLPALVIGLGKRPKQGHRILQRPPPPGAPISVCCQATMGSYAVAALIRTPPASRRVSAATPSRTGLCMAPARTRSASSADGCVPPPATPRAGSGGSRSPSTSSGPPPASARARNQRDPGRRAAGRPHRPR